MKNLSCLSLCFLSFFALSLSAQQTAPVFEGVPVASPSDPNLAATLASFYVFDIPSAHLHAHLRANLQPGDEKQFALQLPGIGTWQIAVQQRGLVASSYRLRVDDGIHVAESSGSGDITWKGQLLGIAPSLVSLTVAERFIFGSIHAPDGVWFIEPLSDLLPGAAPDRFIVYRTSDVLPNPALGCGTTEVFEKKEEQTSERQVGDCKHIELAIASDFGMFSRYLTAVGVETHNIGVMNEVATDYDDPFADELIYVIATQYVSANAATSLELALTSTTEAPTLLTNFRDWGNAGNFGVTYDIGQLWVTRDICVTGTGCGVVGYASIGVVCGVNRYHLLEDYTGTNPGGTGWQLRVLTSHEIGHNFSCSHDPSGSGTIMSPSVNNTDVWSAQSVSQVNSFLTGISCLSICGANFEATAYSAAEGMSATLLSSGDPECEMNYSELLIPVTFSGTAGGSVSVSATGGTAIEGLDFDIPNGTVTFSGGTTTETQNLIVRIWNDAHVEGSETIELEISGGDAGGQNTTTVTLHSDDINPVTGFYQFGQVGNGNVGNIYAPFHGAFQDCRAQIVLGASELSAAGFAANDIINGLALDVASKSSTQPYNGFTIKMKHTTGTPASGGEFENNGFATVFSASHTTSLSWNKFNFTQNFVWNGSSNVRIEFCYDNSSTSGNDFVRTSSGAVTIYDEANAGSGCALPESNWIYPSNRPNVRLYKGSEIAITLQDEANTNLKSGQTAYFKDAQNEFVLAIQHTVGPNPDCVNVEIDRSGTGRQSVPWLPGYFISDKTFLVTSDNPASTFDLTLYYAESEVSVWGAETSTLNIITSSTPISAADASTAFINESVVYAVFGPASNADLYRSYKATFTGMAGGFALTNAPLSILPVEWLDFSAKWMTDKVRLTWTTAAEQNNAGFDVERSLDGVAFEKIGFVAGRGTTQIPQPYYFDDLNVAKINVPVLYYRLRQIDHDGKSSYSRIAPVRLSGVQPIFLLYPNPARESVTLYMQECEECTVNITVTDAAGRVVLQLESADAVTPIDMSGWPAGVYLASVKSGDAGQWQTKLVKW